MSTSTCWNMSYGVSNGITCFGVCVCVCACVRACVCVRARACVLRASVCVFILSLLSNNGPVEQYV